MVSWATSLGRWGMATMAAGLLASSLATGAGAREFYTNDEDYAEARGWSVSYNRDRGGCFAYAEYSGGYRIWFGFMGRNKEGFLAISNEKWSKVSASKSYDVKFTFDRSRTWNGTGSGFVLKASQGVEIGDLKEKFLIDFARSSSVSFTMLGVTDRLSLSGTTAGMLKAIECYEEAAAAGRLDPPSPDNPDPAPVARTPDPAPAPAPTPPPKRDVAAVERPDKPEPKGISTGTGFFVNMKGAIITNAHVVEGCTEATVRLTDGRMVPAKVLARSKENDLAVLSTGLTPPAAARLRSEAPIRLGDDIVVFGFPLAGELTITGNLTTGLVSAMAGLGEDVSQMQITAPVQSGNSGGPVLDRGGQVVGVVVAKSNVLARAGGKVEVLQNINFAIKSSILALFLEAHSVEFERQPTLVQLGTADVADKAKSFTALLMCEPR